MCRAGTPVCFSARSRAFDATSAGMLTRSHSARGSVTAGEFGKGGDDGVDVVLSGEVAGAEAEGAAGRSAQGGVHAGGAVEAGAGLDAPLGVEDGGELLWVKAGDVEADDADAI